MSAESKVPKRYKKCFSSREVTVLQEQMAVKFNTIRKYNNGVSGKRKADAMWAGITAAVNAEGNGPRSTHQVKEKWRNLVSIVLLFDI